jgi:hypothetical protein
MGRTLVNITGTNFRLPDPIAPGPPPYEVIQTVSVLFGAEPALEVFVYSDTLVGAVAPINDQGTVSITVKNLDNAGVPIAGETATLANAYTFKVPEIGAEFPSDLQRLVRQMLRELKRQVLPDVTEPVPDDATKTQRVQRVVLTVHTDYDEDTGAMLASTKLSRLPGLILVGPELIENRFFSVNKKPEFDEGGPDEDVTVTRVPVTVDLVFSIVGVSDHTMELLNLMALLLTFFESNRTLAMLRSTADPSKGKVAYEMDWTDGGQPRVSGASSDSNIRSFSGSFEIRGFDIEAAIGLASGETTTGVPKHEVVERSRRMPVDESVEIEFDSFEP